MNPRLTLALISGKSTALLTRTLKRGGGTAAPGLVAERIDPNILGHLTRQFRQGSIIISGTNGKTTTSRLLSHILKSAGVRAAHNRSGSNLTRGIASTLIEKASLAGKINADIGLFEVDEAALTQAAPQIKPRILVLNNLFRDQLDRYFELDQVVVRWRKVLDQLPVTSTVCLNADDPRVAYLGQYFKGRILYFGVESSNHKLDGPPQSADSLNCPRCGRALRYEQVYLGHQGKYFCHNCQFRRPDLDIAGSKITLDGLSSVRFELSTPKGRVGVQLGVPGFYNVYNALAAATAGIALEQSLTSIQGGLGEFKAAFGRIERIPVGDKEVLLTLVKNPTGFNEVLRMLAGTAKEHLLLALNDLTADGKDVSWIWDVELEQIATHRGSITISGIRAWELANRLKYAGVNPNLLQIQPDLGLALKSGLDNTPEGQTLFVLPTYTAMLEIRQILVGMGHIGNFWDD